MHSEPPLGRRLAERLRGLGPGVVVAVAVAGGIALAVGLAVLGDGDRVRAWVEAYGLYALFGLMILEGAMLMYVMPSEAIVPAAVALVARSPTDVVVVVLVAVAGATVGQLLLFGLAKRAGRQYLLGRRWFRLSDAQLDRFDGWFRRWGPLAVPASNALLFTRGMLTVPAGLARMGGWRFLALSALGTLLFQSWLSVLALGLLGRF